MSLYLDNAVSALIDRVRLEWNSSSYEPVQSSPLRRIVETAIAGTTAELRAQVAELKLANLTLATENERLTRQLDVANQTAFHP